MHVEPLDEQLYDARLLGREQLVPQRVEALQRLAHLGLGQVRCLGPCRGPGAHHHLGLAQQRPDLAHHRRLDLRGRPAAHFAPAASSPFSTRWTT
jgi:hypothetical protein